MRRIPLWSHDGSIKDYALVDDDDFDRINIYRWRVGVNKRNRYAVRTTPRQADGRRHTIRMHRQIMGLELGDGLQVDHVNQGLTLDNRKSNLRIATNAENQQNLRAEGNKTYKGNPRTDSVRGVNWRKDRKMWRARVRLDGVLVDLGSFADKGDAIQAAKEARRQLMPFSST